MVESHVKARNPNANGWFGVEKNNDKWVYTTTKDEVDNAVQDWSDNFPKTGADGGFSCAYFLGKDGTWKNDEDCSKVTENFLCEF